MDSLFAQGLECAKLEASTTSQQQKEGVIMKGITMGIDLAKNVFEVYGRWQRRHRPMEAALALEGAAVAGQSPTSASGNGSLWRCASRCAGVHEA